MKKELLKMRRRDPSETGCVYVGSAGGHRESYVDTLSRVTGLPGYIASRSAATIRRLLAFDKLLFATLEDDIPLFQAVAVSRALAGRETAALVMGAGRCFERGHIKYPIKRLAFQRLARLQRVKMLSILPFYLDKRFASVTNSWIYDPQFWDLAETIECGSWPTSNLAYEIVRAAKGRPIFLFLGGPSRMKGFGFLADILRAHPDLAQLLAIVVAGRIPADHSEDARALRHAGARIVDRYLTDDEVISLKRRAACLWACYDPFYNSSSGLFGRSLQLGKQVIVRRGSFLDRMAEYLKYPAYRCTFGDVAEGAAVLRRISEGIAEPVPEVIPAHCRDLSVRRLLEALGFDRISLPDESAVTKK